MHISKLKIKNFKCFDEVEINFDLNCNLIIGENNGGKSITLDALRLWQLAFKKFQKDRIKNQESSFYASQFFSLTLDDISFLQIVDFPRLFKKKGNKDKIFEISITVSSDSKTVSIPIIFYKTTEGQVFRFELCKQTGDRLSTSQLLSNISNKAFGSDIKEVFLFTYINPIFILPTKEPLFLNSYILIKLHEPKANEVIRNILYQIFPEKMKIKKQGKNKKIIEIENSLNEILQIQDILFSKRLENEESYIRIFSKNQTLDIKLKINLLGSVTKYALNVLFVLAYGDYEKFSINALLIDEPYSHLHFNHQSRLFKYLEKVSQDLNKQIFIITHNSSLISQFDNVLFIKKDEKIIYPIPLNDNLENHLKDIDYNHYKVMIALHNVKKEIYVAQRQKEEVEKQLNQITKPIYYCEGSIDVVILYIVYKSIFNQDLFNNSKSIDDAGGTSFLTINLRFNTNNCLIIKSLFNNDFEGNKQKNYLIKEKFKKNKDFHFQKSYKKKDNYSKEALLNNHFLLLLIPENKIELLTYYEENGFIKCMFNCKILENKLQVELIEELGRIHKIIKTEIKGDKNKKQVVQAENDKVKNNKTKLSKEDFKNFTPLFEKIA